MTINQISVFVDNEKGRLVGITDVLAKNGVNIRALYVADTTDYGILRMIVDDAHKVKAILKEAGYTVHITPVIAIAMEDRPGEFHRCIDMIAKAGISIEYVYAFTGRSRSGRAALVMRVEDAEAASDTLEKAGAILLDESGIAGMFN